MADFRKLFLALVAVTLLFGTAASAVAQNPYSCDATAVPTLVRSEGIAELVGDILLTCSGTVPASGIQANIRVQLNTNITSNVLSGSTLEATLVLDERNPNARPWRGYYSTFPDYRQNVFQGTKISDTEVEFDGVVLAAANSSAGIPTIRITNLRANAQALGLNGTVYAIVNITGSTTIPVNNAQLRVADTRQGLKFSVTPSTSKNCQSGQSFSVSWQEGFASAFRAKGSVTDPAHQVPGGSYGDESGFNPYPLDTNTTLTGASSIGQANQGTRLLARMSNVPSGVTLSATAGTPLSSGLALQAVTSPNSDWSGGTLTSPSGVTATSFLLLEVTASPSLSLATIETVTAGVAVNYSVPGPLGTGSVTGSFAPLSTTFTASSSAPEPRFIDTGAAATAFTIGPCRTILLFPFVTNQAGFDTGIAIANTSMDPLGTTNQSGACTLNYYGVTGQSGPPPAAQTTGAVAAGSVAVGTLSSGGGIPAAPNFQGYIFAICNFQYAHGYAFISDLGAQKLAQGYLALVVPDKTGGRQPADSSLGAAVNDGEQLSN